jgi:hypothetical protein
MKPKGNCYEAAARLQMESKQDCFLVHAEVIGQGQLTGLPFGHAWVECGDMVYDYSNGRNLEIPKQLYYLLGKVEETRVWTDEGVLDREPKIFRYNLDWGPWELETESGY